MVALADFESFTCDLAFFLWIEELEPPSPWVKFTIFIDFPEALVLVLDW